MTIRKIEQAVTTTPEYFVLNNELNIIKNNSIQINKDKEAVRNYFLTYVNNHTKYFEDLEEKIAYLVDEKYIDPELIGKYTFPFIKKLFKQVYAFKFRFNTFMGAYKFYNQYALRTTDGKTILERYEDRVVFNALELANGNKALAMKIADEIVNRRYQPATPTFN